MSGGGMGFLFDPRHKPAAKVRMQEIMDATKGRMEDAVPFAMQPVVYDFAINERGTWAEVHGPPGGTTQRREGAAGLMPADYYRLTVPDTLRQDPWLLTSAQRAELEIFGAASGGDPALVDVLPSLIQRMMPQKQEEDSQDSLAAMLAANAFDREQHEQIRGDLRSGADRAGPEPAADAQPY